MFIDPTGYVKWDQVSWGLLEVVGGGIAVVAGAAGSTTGVGAIGGVPAAIGGAAAFGHGVTQIIAGALDQELGIPTPSAAALGTMVGGGDLADAQLADEIEDLLFLAVGGVSYFGTPPGNLWKLEGVGLCADGTKALFDIPETKKRTGPKP